MGGGRGAASRAPTGDAGRHARTIRRGRRGRLRRGTERMRAWQVTKFGRPTEALALVDAPDPVPGPGEVLVRATASVCNYNEVDGCHGRYLTINPTVPYTLGMECVGTVVAAGPGEEAWIGRRVTAS